VNLVEAAVGFNILPGRGFFSHYSRGGHLELAAICGVLGVVLLVLGRIGQDAHAKLLQERRDAESASEAARLRGED
jgi:hypothetical protein